MSNFNLRFFRAAVLLLLTLTPAMRMHNSASAAPASTAKPTIAYFPPEVRLRRIHLVRPDLIPYPIQYSIVC
jgi:hypothetical protein